MRHRKDTIKLGRTSSHRKAMFRNMVTSLFKYDRIRTTDVKAKELRRWADHLITLAKRGDLHARRMALSIIRERDVVQKLFDEASEKYGSVSGGYTRIVKIGRRPGDAAPVSVIELISSTGEGKKKEKKAKKKTPKAAPAVEQKPVEKEETPDEPVTEATAPEEEAAPEVEVSAEETAVVETPEETPEEDKTEDPEEEKK